MWIKSQSSRLVNLERIESLEVVSRRENTAGSVVFEIVARPYGGQVSPYVLARFTEEEPAQKLFSQVVVNLKSGATVFEISE